MLLTMIIIIIIISHMPLPHTPCFLDHFHEILFEFDFLILFYIIISFVRCTWLPDALHVPNAAKYFRFSPPPLLAHFSSYYSVPNRCSAKCLTPPPPRPPIHIFIFFLPSPFSSLPFFVLPWFALLSIREGFFLAEEYDASLEVIYNLQFIIPCSCACDSHVNVNALI